MKKSNLLIVPLIGLASFLGVMLSNTNMTEAENNKTCSPEFFRDNSVAKIEVSYDANQVTIKNNSGLNLTYTIYADGDTTNGTSGDFADGASSTFTVTSGGTVQLFLKEDMSDPCKAKAGTEIGSIQVNVDGLIDNPLYNDSVCVNYRNKWGNNKIMQNAVPYCYSARTYEVYSKDVVQGWINTAEELYDAINSSDGDNEIIIDDSYKKVDDVKNTDKLVCDAFSTNNYETMHKYYHIESETNNNCEVTCKEEIEVNFSDPVATQPGMCFQYLIEIKSKVVCNSSYKAAPPTRKPVCYPSPLCMNGSGSFDAGGPSEEFDSCVLACDDGKYSQKCINKCYNKVYGNKKTATKTSDEKLTKKEVEAISPLYVESDNFYEATQIANSCDRYSEQSIRSGRIGAEELYNYRQQHPGGYYKNGNWIQSDSDGCASTLGPYYFRSLEQTRRTIDMIKGRYSYNRRNKYYTANGNGILQAVHKDNTYCSDTCIWTGSCGSNTVLTEAIAQKEYEKAVEEYLAAKKACEEKEATCTNETTDYKIVVDNLDPNDSKDDEDKSDWQEDFTSSQKMNSTNVTGKFPSMVILTDGSCEDGEDDPWHYHNIITFPGAWINNKTGQIVHSIQPGHEDFYTYIGNQYCTKLNSIPVNTAWYDWKVNKNGDSSALTDSEKEQIENNLDMNIRGHIDNYGYFGWDFDVSCFYAVDTPTDNSKDCSPDNPNWPDCDNKGNKDKNESPVNNYTFRAIALDNLFPNSATQTSSGDVSKDVAASRLINQVEDLRNNSAVKVADTNTRPIGFNWTCAATNLENEDYIIQPVSLIKQIQTLGDSIYEGDEYLDYHIRLTPETMNKVRNYNKKYDSYTEPVSNNNSEVLTAGTKKTSGITVYRSYLLHKVLNSSELLKSGLIGCNNQDGDQCPNTIDKSTTCYNEYMAQSAILKGAE